LDKNPPEIDIIWADFNQAVIDPDMEMVMIEARVGYYEAVRHTLVGLQMASDSESSLYKYVLGQDTKDRLASFILQKPEIDLTPLLQPSTDAATRAWLRKYDVREPTPDILQNTTMDETQLHALYRMITKELCIVQGPPGTGKTFTSVEALKVMLANQGPDDPPVIIAAQTNHALDQLLDLSLDGGARIVRVGGRTESDRIDKYTMYQLRQSFASGPDPTWRLLESDRKKHNQDILGLANTVFHDYLLHPHDLLAADILTREQFESLVDEDAEQTSGHLDDGPFSMWLSGEIVETDRVRNKYSEQDLAGDDEDFFKDEFEFDGDDLKHIAADDEEDNRIRGFFVPLAYKWSGKLPCNLDNVKRRAQRESKRSDLYKVPKDMRGVVYQLFLEQYIATLKPMFAHHFKQYAAICKELTASKWRQDAAMVRNLRLNIVGCTTTGLTKYRGLLAALGAKTMLIEEAAETREANIVSALYPSIQQLILVGDHQQLTPFSAVKWLSQAPYYLDLSMFERMVEYLSIPYIMLDVQRRMAPEIRSILGTFYRGLTDHPVAKQRQPVPGMGDRRTWLFAHNWEDSVDANHSRFNVEEANMIANFFAYLVNNGNDPHKITVLTYYMAQRRTILRKLRQLPSLGAESYHVHTVDSYQGEENDVVLLSLVRSPAAHADFAVGFLESQNRAIVAISRARRGFYMFGNMVNAVNATKESSELWGPIWDAFIRQKRVDASLGLPLQCQPHGNVIWIKNNSAWGDNAGGCDKRCDYQRPCGHQCTLLCHVKPHDKIKCSQVCGKALGCGHECQKWCKDACNCVCDKFQAAKMAVQTRQMQDEARLHMDLEDILQQEAGLSSHAAARGIQPRLIRQEALLLMDLRDSAVEEIDASGSDTLLENVLVQVAGLSTRDSSKRIQHGQGQTQEDQPLCNALHTPTRRREAARLNTDRLPMMLPPEGNIKLQIGQDSFRGSRLRSGQREMPQMILPGQNSNLSMNVPSDGVAANVAGNKYQQLAQNIAAHDRANAQAHRASLAKTAGVQPEIRETYRPVEVVNGRRVEGSSGGSSPEKMSRTTASAHLSEELTLSTPVPEPVTEDVVTNGQSDLVAGGAGFATNPSFAQYAMVPPVVGSHSSRSVRQGRLGGSKTGSPAKIDLNIMAAKARFQATVTSPGHMSSRRAADLRDAAMVDLGGRPMQVPEAVHSPSTYRDLHNWVEGLTVGPPPGSVATCPSSRPSSTDATDIHSSSGALANLLE
jgi:helicase required for RNAi-mediated heterochromatin assembly 1